MQAGLTLTEPQISTTPPTQDTSPPISSKACASSTASASSTVTSNPKTSSSTSTVPPKLWTSAYRIAIPSIIPGRTAGRLPTRRLKCCRNATIPTLWMTMPLALLLMSCFSKEDRATRLAFNSLRSKFWPGQLTFLPVLSYQLFRGMLPISSKGYLLSDKASVAKGRRQAGF